MRYSVGSGLGPRCNSRYTRTCCDMAAAMPSQRRPRHQGAAGMAGTQKHPAHRAVYRAGAGQVQELLAVGLTVGARAQPLTRPNSLAHHARATSAGVLLIANRCPPPIQNDSGLPQGLAGHFGGGCVLTESPSEGVCHGYHILLRRLRCRCRNQRSSGPRT